MRDKRFIAELRGGLLNMEQHLQLMIWACKCAEHVLQLLGEKTDERLKKALLFAKQWEHRKVTVGEARKASLGAFSMAKESSDPTSIAVALSVGHAAATAHMADHSIVAAFYALKAMKRAGRSADAERKWQNEQLPSEITELVLTARSGKEKSLKI
jgi:hypothetical protein